MTWFNRRGVFAALLAASGGTRAASAEDSAKPRVVYHLADLEKVNFVLSNMQNHIKGVGGADQITLALVVHGPALAAFKRSGNIAIEAPFAALLQAGVRFQACGNTLQGLKLSLADLLDGFSEIHEGGVVRLASLQAQGWAYLRP